MSDPLDQFAHVTGQFAREGEALARHRVDEPEHRRMERLSLEAEFAKNRSELRTGSSIDRVSN